VKSKTRLWGWLLLALGIFALYVCWLNDAYMLFSWIMVANCAITCWLALTGLRLGPTQFLLTGACLLNMVAGTANGLVMAANGGRMPVEDVYYGNTPAFFDGEGARHGLICRLLKLTDDGITPADDAQVHYDVPPPIIMHGKVVRSEDPPRLAFLDDRDTVRICGRYIVHSKGDMMGFIGTVMLGLPGLALLILGFLWRKLRRKPRASIE
jgi:hypothetical protein